MCVFQRKDMLKRDYLFLSYTAKVAYTASNHRKFLLKNGHYHVNYSTIVHPMVHMSRQPI